MITPGKISREEFDKALGSYPDLIKSISVSKTSTNQSQGQLTLEQLDKYRFEVAPSHYYKKNELDDPEAAPTPLSHADVVKLVQWKLKHGTFRPNLLKLAESNPSKDIKETTLEAFQIYKKDSFNPTKAIAKLITLHGIGPATASLLLSVHDAARVPFFSDELYQWICHDGAKANIKYTVKEYEDLVTKSRQLIDRIDADARDVEKVAFVLVKEAASSSSSSSSNSNSNTNTNDSTKPPPKKRGRPRASASTNGTQPAAPKEKKPRGRGEPAPAREPTDMTSERKAQLQEIAEKARVARVAKRSAKEASKLAKGTKFRERIDAARERKKGEEGSSDAAPPETPLKAAGGLKRQSDVLTRGTASAAKRARRSEIK